MIVVYILAAIGVLALAMMFYNWLVPDQSEIAPRDSSEDRRLDAEESARALSANFNAPLIDGNAVDMLRNGDEIFPAMLDAIRGAQHSVNLLTYICWQGDIASQIAAELGAASRRGVTVRVLVDAVGGGRMTRDTIDALKQAGCKFAWFRPLRWYDLGRFSNRPTAR